MSRTATAMTEAPSAAAPTPIAAPVRRRRRRPPPLIVPEPCGTTSLPPQCYDGWRPASPTRAAQVGGVSSRPLGAATRRGAGRRFNEDRAFASGSRWGVCDGHGGARAAEYVARCLGGTGECAGGKWPDAAAIRALDANLSNALAPDQGYTGTTLTAVALGDRVLRTVHVGDSRAVVLRSDGLARVLTADHVPTRADEAARVASAGGAVLRGRVDGVLAVSRALGDPALPSVAAEPDVGEYPLTQDDSLLVLATDGFFDVVRAEELATVLGFTGTTTNNTTATTTNGVVPLDLQGAAVALVDLAAHRASTDDITVMLVDLRDGTCGVSHEEHSHARKCGTATWNGSFAPS